MSNFKEMKGHRFGRLVVIEMSHRGGPRNEIFWVCKCDCGAEHVARGSSLRGGNTKSCGCLKEDIARNLATKEGMAGRRFGSLLVLYRADIQKSGAYWMCRCDCGSLHVARATALRSGHTKSCGCMRGKALMNDGVKTGVKVGDIYGKLKVVERLVQTVQGSCWACVCSCGGRLEARGKDLRNGNTTSCGCAKRESQKAAGERYRLASVELRP